jgi:Tol biopolymer transport system component
MTVMGLPKPFDDPRLKQLDRVLASDVFSGPGRLGRFLKFVVEETASGRSGQIKEYVIGLEVYEKPESWDPKIDSTVRTEAAKLRSRLSAYYETDGLKDPIVITVPKGTYVPMFVTRNVIDMPATVSLGPEPAPPVLVRARRPRVTRWYALAGAAAVIAGMVLILWRPASQPGPALPKRITSDLAYNTDPALSSEGKLVAYASDRSGRGDLDIWITPVNGGEPLRLTEDPANESGPDLSPDGSLVVFTRYRESGEIWIVPALGGPARMLARDGQRPRFSPDGKQVAYFSGDMRAFNSSVPTGRVFVQPVAGGAVRRIAADFDVAVEPLWISPAKILFRGNPKGADFWSTSADWYIADLESHKAIPTGVVSRLAAQGLCRHSASFTPEAWTGSAVVVAVNCDGLRDLWRVPLAGAATRLTFGNTAAARPSAAGESAVAFASVENRTSIWEIALDPATEQPKGEPRRLTTNAAPERQPSLSPDGKWFSYTTERNGNEDVILRNLESGRETFVANGPNRETHSEFTADGRSIVWMEVIVKASPPGALQHRVWRRDLEGGAPQALCEDCGYGGPAPDGSRYLVIDGPRIRMVQVDPATGRSSTYLEHPHNDVFLVRPSPNRRWMSFNVRHSGDRVQTHLAAFRDPAPPERDWIPLGPGGSTAWSPSGRFLYFQSRRDTTRCLWRQAIDPETGRPLGDPEPIAHFHAAAKYLSPGPDVLPSFSVSRDRVVFAVTENTGNIWLLRR